MKKDSEQPVLYFKYFILAVLICAVVSFSIRIVTLVTGSNFKGESFNILFIGKNATLVHIDTSERKMYTQTFENGGKYFLGKNRIALSANLGVLVDGIVKINHNAEMPSFSDLIFEPGNKLSDINQFDLLKMDYYTKTIPSENKKFANINFSSKNVLGINNISKNYLDNGILNEEESISVVNASGKDGLATVVGIALKNVGFNVVKMTSMDLRKSEIIAKDSNNLSAGRLERSLGFPLKVGVVDPSADIVVIIGTDYDK